MPHAYAIIPLHIALPPLPTHWHGSSDSGPQECASPLSSLPEGPTARVPSEPFPEGQVCGQARIRRVHLYRCPVQNLAAMPNRRWPASGFPVTGRTKRGAPWECISAGSRRHLNFDQILMPRDAGLLRQLRRCTVCKNGSLQLKFCRLATDASIVETPNPCDEITGDFIRKVDLVSLRTVADVNTAETRKDGTVPAPVYEIITAEDSIYAGIVMNLFSVWPTIWTAMVRRQLVPSASGSSPFVVYVIFAGHFLTR